MRNYHSMKNSDLTLMLKNVGLKLGDLARLANVDKATATRWAQKRIPAERVIDVERLTGIPRECLRPDVYPSPDLTASSPQVPA